jgi:hypothetical protein
VVAREIKCLELRKLADLCWNWPSYVVVLQETATGENKEKPSGQKGTPNTERASNDEAIIIINERKKNTHTVLMFVRFPMVGESMPERFLLGASLPNNEQTQNNGKNIGNRGNNKAKLDLEVVEAGVATLTVQ